MFEYGEVKKQIEAMLQVEPGVMKDEDNLIELGINSLKVMRLVNVWRKKGAKVNFAKLISNPTLENWWKLLSAGDTKSKENKSLALPKQVEHKVYPLTDVQYAYWIGRRKGQVLGNVGCHAYLEIDTENLKQDKIQEAWEKLIHQHPALRTRFTDEGKQEILKEAPYKEVVYKDLRGQSEEECQRSLEAIREELSHRKLRIEEGENAGLTVSLISEEKSRIHFDVDLLAADVQSFQILLRDLAKLYNNETLVSDPNWSFGEYLNQVEEQTVEAKKEAEAFWKEKIPNMPTGPKLPLQKSAEEIKHTVFKARKASFSKAQWEVIKQKAAKYQITPAMVFLTIYSEVLERWSENSRFLINLPIFNRHTEFEGIEDVVADFSNILLLDVDCTQRKSFIERAREIQDNFHKDIQHVAYSGVEVTRELAKYYPEEKMIAPVVFACNLGEPLLDANFRNTFGELSFMLSQTPQVWIDFQMFDYNEGLLIKWDAVEELFNEGMLNQMFESVCDIIEDLAKEDSDWESEVSIKNIDREVEERNEKYNITEDVKMTSMLEGLVNYAKENPKKVALIQGDTKEEITYGGLLERVLKLASYLRQAGVQKQDVVAISMKRGIYQVIGALGILAAGGIYTPIGLNQPEERRKSMCQRACAHYVLTSEESLKELIQVEGVKTLVLEESEEVIPLEEVVKQEPDASSYIIFTSGSTGEPKGVEISHGGAMNTIEVINKKCNITDKDTALAVSSIEFDLSVYDIFGMLNAGGTLVCIKEDERRNADYWVEMVKTYNVTVWNSVPILFDMLLVALESNHIMLDQLRWVFLSGDWIGLTLPARMKEQAPNSKMLAMGGATEASIWSNFYEVTLPLDERWKSIPYGYPLYNQKYIIMDENKRPCPPWVPGELWIGGKGVAVSYINDAELTNQKFVMYNGERWYRTGDLGRYWKDGKIEFLGRRDFQVKIRGHRIELGEIESALLKHEAIKDVVVVAKEMTSGQKELLAFIVVLAEEVKEEALKEYLIDKVPEYMVPKHYVFLEALPLSNNGKVDRKKLLQLSKTYEIKDEIVKHSPETETEKQLAAIWKELLNQEEVYMEDSYFELGGNSLIATRLSAAIRKVFNIKFMIEDVFDYVKFNEQIKRIEALLKENQAEVADLATEKVAITMDEEGRFKPFPLTEIQKAYWIGRKGIYDLGSVSTHYYFEIENKGFDIDRFNKALETFIYSHDMMRAVVQEDGEHQIVLEEIPPYIMKQYDLGDLSEEEVKKKTKEIRDELTHRVFKAEEWPLFDIRVTKLPYDTTRLHLCFDNIIFDGYSIFFFFNEINRIYEEACYEIKKPSITFRDYILEVEKLKQTPAFEEDKKYWMDRLYTLAPAPELTIKEAHQHTFYHLEHRMPKGKWERIKKHLIKVGGVTPSVFLITAYSEILATWSRRQKFTLNLTRFNRMELHPNINEVVGDFTSLNLLEVDMETQNSFVERCKLIQKQLLKDLAHPLFCGVQMQRELGKVQSGRSGVLMPVVFTSSLGLEVGETKGTNWFKNRIFSSSETPQVWLDHQVTEEDGSLILIWDYIKEIFPENMVDEMFEAYLKLLDSLCEDMETWNQTDSHIVKLPNIAEFEEENQKHAPVLNETLIGLVDKQFKAVPNNVAVIYHNESLTYGELDKAVSKVAKSIVSQRKGKSPLIGIFMEKGMEQVIAALGIIRAGAGYLPIDPHHPAERTNNLLEEAKVDMILTQSWISKKDIMIEKWIDVDIVVSAEDTLEESLLENINAKPEDVAYVIYTSGSTGKPKGVAIDHKSAVNTIIDVNKRFNVNEKDRSIALSNLNFDLSVYDIFGLLSAGGAIVIPEEQQLKNPPYWLELLEAHKITIWNTVPTFMNMLTEFIGKEKENKTLRLVMLSGDWIPMTLPEQVKEIFTSSKFVSLGGATEASIWSNFYVVEEMDSNWNSIPYGKPLTNQALYVYNDRLQPCPCGICGELYIGGEGVAVGYWNDEKRTSERFIIHPITKERIYKTGDLARYMEDGNIEFLGREDNQVKIRGFRIELGEIENAISQYDAVKDNIVIADTSQQQLTAFITPETVDNSTNYEILKLQENKVILKLKDAMQKSKNKIERMIEEIDLVSICAAKDLLEKIGAENIDERFKALIKHWNRILEKADPISLEGVALSEEALGLKEYYRAAENHYTAILKGEKDVISLFLDQDFAKLFSKLNFYDGINNYYYDAMIEIIDKYVDLRGEKVISVLEVGTRFGSLLDKINDSSLKGKLNYTYTDESNYFLQDKKSKYQDLNFEIFDMNKSVESQEISRNKYNVILADNALHRAKNIDEILVSVKKLLTDDGILLFVENTEMNTFDLNVAGLYEYGFSQYEDERGETNLPFYSKEMWTKKLEQNGMEIVSTFGEEFDEIYKRCVYVVKAKQNVRTINISELTQFVVKRIPDYMVPKRYIVLTKLPITPNGKIDRKHLLSIIQNDEARVTKNIILPKNEVEEFILKLWQEILQVEVISVEDNFFEIGGDSLIAIQCMNKLVKAYGVDVSLQEIFTSNSIRKLASIIMEKQILDEDMDEGEI